MNTDLQTRIQATLKECDSIKDQHDEDPFAAEVIEAEGSLTSAEALLAETEGEPENLSPEKIVEMRAEAEKSKQVAEITLRRANSKRSQYSSLLWQKARETRADAQALIHEAREQFEAKIETALLELAQGFWSEYMKGVSVPKEVARHRAAALHRAENSLSDRFPTPDTLDGELSRIRRALETALEHFESKP